MNSARECEKSMQDISYLAVERLLFFRQLDS